MSPFIYLMQLARLCLQYWKQAIILSSKIPAESHCHKTEFVEETQIHIIFYLFSVDALIMKAFMQLVSSQNLFTDAKVWTLRRLSIFIHTFWNSELFG